MSVCQGHEQRFNIKQNLLLSEGLRQSCATLQANFLKILKKKGYDLPTLFDICLTSRSPLTFRCKCLSVYWKWPSSSLSVQKTLTQLPIFNSNATSSGKPSLTCYPSRFNSCFLHLLTLCVLCTSLLSPTTHCFTKEHVLFFLVFLASCLELSLGDLANPAKRAHSQPLCLTLISICPLGVCLDITSWEALLNSGELGYDASPIWSPPHPFHR